MNLCSKIFARLRRQHTTKFMWQLSLYKTHVMNTMEKLQQVTHSSASSEASSCDPSTSFDPSALSPPDNPPSSLPFFFLPSSDPFDSRCKVLCRRRSIRS